MWDTNYPECLAEATWLVLVGMTKHLAFEATLHENKWQSQGHGNLFHPVALEITPSGLPTHPFCFSWASCNYPDLSAQNCSRMQRKLLQGEFVLHREPAFCYSSRGLGIRKFVAPEAVCEDGEARVISRDSRLRSGTGPQPVRGCERRRVPLGNGALAYWRCVPAAGMEHVDRPCAHHGVSRPLRLCQLARFVRSACWLRLQDAPCELGPAVGVRRGCGAARARDRRLAVLHRHVLDVPCEYWMSWILEILS